MEIKELKKFVDMVSVYEYVGELVIGEQEQIDTITELGFSKNYKAIETLFNNDDFDSADELMTEHFGHNTYSLNVLADEFGYQRVAS